MLTGLSSQGDHLESFSFPPFIAKQKWTLQLWEWNVCLAILGISYPHCPIQEGLTTRAIVQVYKIYQWKISKCYLCIYIYIYTSYIYMICGFHAVGKHSPRSGNHFNLQQGSATTSAESRKSYIPRPGCFYYSHEFSAPGSKVARLTHCSSNAAGEGREVCTRSDRRFQDWNHS